MRSSKQELTLKGALSDPLIATLMAADHVDPTRLETMLRQVARHVAVRVAMQVATPRHGGCGCPA